MLADAIDTDQQGFNVSLFDNIKGANIRYYDERGHDYVFIAKGAANTKMALLAAIAKKLESE